MGFSASQKAVWQQPRILHARQTRVVVSSPPGEGRESAPLPFREKAAQIIVYPAHHDGQ